VELRGDSVGLLEGFRAQDGDSVLTVRSPRDIVPTNLVRVIGHTMLAGVVCMDAERVFYCSLELAAGHTPFPRDYGAYCEMKMPSSKMKVVAALGGARDDQ
jgi:hypothetical protein